MRLFKHVRLQPTLPLAIACLLAACGRSSGTPADSQPHPFVPTASSPAPAVSPAPLEEIRATHAYRIAFIPKF